MAESEQESGDLDFKRVIEKSTSEVALSDLQRKGFKQVKVLNRRVIFQLIAEAVDAVITDRRQQIGQEERGKVIEESRAKFDAMAQERLQIQQELADLRHFREHAESTSRSEAALRQALEDEVELYKSRAGRADELQAETERLQSELARARAQIEELRAELETSAGQSGEIEKIRASAREALAGKAEAENLLEEARTRLGTSQGEVESLREELAAAKALLEESQNQKSEVNSQQFTMALLSKLGEKSSQNTEIGALQASIESLANKIAFMGTGGGGGGGGGFGPVVDGEIDMERLFAVSTEDGLESNVSKVEVKESKAGGVKNTLAKLKALQQGGAKDGE